MRVICIVIFFIVISVSMGEWVYSQEKQKVLVLHSYHQGMEWTDNINKGIKSVFDPLGKEVEVYFEYLDSKRIAFDSIVEYSPGVFEHKFKGVFFNLAIVADNNALDYSLLHYNKFFSEVPVIFCGINNFDPLIVSRYPNITGVVESPDFSGTLSLMRNMHPLRDKILVINDLTPTGMANRRILDKALSSFAWSSDVEFYDDFSLLEIKEKLRGLSSRWMIYLLSMNRDRNNNYLSYADAIDYVDTYSKVPIYGSWEFYMGNGLLGGVFIRGFEQGEIAAKMALRVLRGTPISTIPVELETPHRMFFDYNYMEEYGLDIGDLPSQAIVINRPPSFFKHYSLEIFIVSLFLALFVVVLSLSLILKQRARRRLELINKQLDDKVEERTCQLKESEKDLRTALSTKDKFFSILAHDLKNPLNAMMGMSQLLRQEYENLDEQQRKEFLDDIYSASQSMKTLLEDLLSWGRIQIGDVDFHPRRLNIRDLVEHVEEGVAKMAEDKQIRVVNDVEVDLWVKADDNMIIAVVRNFLVNAIKFTPLNGNVKIVSSREGDFLRIAICDDGIGISTVELPKLFKMDTKVQHAGTQEETGTGLGLVLCKEFVTRHGGVVGVESELGKGSCFYFTLPVQE